MWKGDLVRSLNWQRDALREKTSTSRQLDARKPTQYLAPSWSWASILGKSTIFLGSMPNQTTTPLTSRVYIINVEIKIEKGRPFTTILHVYLTLEGQVLEVDNHLSDVSRHHRLSATQANMKRLMDTVLFRDDFVQQHRPHEAQKVFILHLCSHRDLDDRFQSENYLLPETAAKDAYRRVGNFGIRRNGERGKRYLRKRGMQLPPEDNLDVRLELKNAAWNMKVIHIV